MLLWDIIRNWFVQYIFGGHIVNDYGETYSYGGWLGSFYSNSEDFINGQGKLSDIYIRIPNIINGADDVVYNYICLGDWLSTTATLIIMISVCVGLFFLVRYFFRMFAGLISGR